MSLENLQNLSVEDQKKVKEFTDVGMRMLQDMEDFREGLKEKTKDLAETLGIDASDLTAHLKAQFKNTFEKAKEKFEILETLAQISGRI